MDTMPIKLMKPLPELFGFKEDSPYCLLAEEASEGETIVSLLRKLAKSHPDFAEIAFKSDPDGEDISQIVEQLNGRLVSRTDAVHGGDILSVFVGGG